MCVRTKTSYGCGHSYKNTEECYSSRCKGLERFHYIHDGDCRSCKRGGDMVTRGREGKGRYAQEIERYRSVRDGSPADELSIDSIDDADDNTETNPWKPAASRQENPWQSPTRKKADEAWELEHEQRISDLQSRLEGLSTTSSVVTPTPTSHRLRHASPERISYNDNRDEQYYSDESARRKRDATAEKLHEEIRSINQEYRPDHYSTGGRHRRSRVAIDRNGSHESVESMPVVHTSVRRYKPVPRSYTYDHYDHYDQHDSGYGSYSSHRSHGYGARTEPYIYAAAAKKPSGSRTYEVSVPPGNYNSGYSAGYGVEIYPRQIQAAQYHRRGY